MVPSLPRRSRKTRKSNQKAISRARTFKLVLAFCLHPFNGVPIPLQQLENGLLRSFWSRSWIRAHSSLLGKRVWVTKFFDPVSNIHN